MTHTNWLTKGLSEEQIKTEKTLSIISAKIYTKRRELDIPEKEFAKLMGVPIRTVKKWESGIYDFSISEIVKINQKLKLW